MGKNNKMIQTGAIRHGLSIGCLFLAFAGSVFAGSWRGLVPLKSTKAEVDALLKEPVFESDSVSNYETDSSKISITYSEGNCREESKNAWNVAKDVVIAITVFPMNEVTYEDLKFDLSKFEKFSASRDLPGMFRYWNADEGISFVGDEHTRSGRNLIVSQSYLPRKLQTGRPDGAGGDICAGMLQTGCSYGAGLGFCGVRVFDSLMIWGNLVFSIIVL
jgi:hypothetical protein